MQRRKFMAQAGMAGAAATSLATPVLAQPSAAPLSIERSGAAAHDVRHRRVHEVQRGRHEKGQPADRAGSRA